VKGILTEAGGAAHHANDRIRRAAGIAILHEANALATGVHPIQGFAADLAIFDH